MENFDTPRMSVWTNAILISLGIWAAIISGLALL